MTREGWDRADVRADKANERRIGERDDRADLTREGWDRADERAEKARKSKPAKPDRLYPVKNREGVTVGQETREEALARTRAAGSRSEALDAEDAAEKAVEENTGYLASDKSDLGGPRDIYKANYIAVLREQPTASPSEIHAEAKRRTENEGDTPGGGDRACRHQSPDDYPHVQARP